MFEIGFYVLHNIGWAKIDLNLHPYYWTWPP